MDGWLTLCFVAITSLLALWFLRLYGAKDNPKKKLPPGPWTLPIIGSLHHVVSALPHRRMMELSRRHGPLMYLRLGEIPTVIVSTAEAASLVMKTNDPVFADRPRSATLDVFSCDGTDIAFAPYGDYWRQVRKVCVVELLSSKQVRRMEGIRTEEVGHLLRSIAAAAGATVNVGEKLKKLSNDVVSRAVFGGKFTRQEEFIRELDQAFSLVAGFSLVDLFPSSRLVRWLSNAVPHIKRSSGRIQRIIADIIDERMAARDAGDRACSTEDEDLLQVLLRPQQEDSMELPLTKENIGAVLFGVFAGGTDTSSIVIEWAMSELVCHPEAMAKAQLEVREMLGPNRVIISNTDLGELHYMRMVIKEVLRLHPPAPLIPRMAREDCKIMGYDMLKGTNVYINIFAVSKDPKYWKNPEDFNPERFENNNTDSNMTNFEYIPFGAGRRQCPGIQFGTSTVHIALANLLYHFDWELPYGASLASFDMSEKFGLTVCKKYALQLRAIPHVSSNLLPCK